jgi:hypothetical protein
MAFLGWSVMLYSCGAGMVMTRSNDASCDWGSTVKERWPGDAEVASATPSAMQAYDAQAM